MTLTTLLTVYTYQTSSLSKMTDLFHIKIHEINVKYKVAIKSTFNSIDLLLFLSEILCHLQ